MTTPFNWKTLGQDDSKRNHRTLLVLGLTETAVGIIGTLIILAIGRTEQLFFIAIFIVTGIVSLLTWEVLRKSTAGPPDP